MVNKWLIINTLRNSHICTNKIKSITIDQSSICSGRYAVTARCNIDNSLDDMLIKCYLVRPRRAKLLYGSLYMKNELGIYKTDGTIEYIDVALSNWVDGIPLNEIMEDPDSEHKLLSHNFDTLAYEVLTSQRCHIDIKPDNIIVRSDDSMVLIDNDAIWYKRAILAQDADTILAKYMDKNKYNAPKHETSTHHSLAIVSTMLAALAHDYKGIIRTIEAGHLMDGNSRHYMQAIERCISIFRVARDYDHLAIVEALSKNSLSYELLYNHIRKLLSLQK